MGSKKLNRWKELGQRLLTVILTVAMVLSFFPVLPTPAYAAGTELKGLNDTTVGLTYEGGTWEASGTTIKGSVTGTSGTCSSSAGETTLTIVNNKSTAVPLSFTYNLKLNGGSATIGSTTLSDGTGTFTQEIPAGSSIQLSMKTQAGQNTTSIEITGFVMVVDKDVTATFQIAQNGSYTVAGEAISAEKSITQSAKVPFAVAATPAAGYKFVAWTNADTGAMLSNKATDSLYLNDDATIAPTFVTEDTPVFSNNGKNFTDFAKAVQSAQAGSDKTIVLVSDGALKGENTLPAGITLLIPFDEAHTLYTDKPASTDTSYTTPAAFRTLSLASGASLHIQGTMSLSAKYCSNGGVGGGGGGAVSGPYGAVNLASGSSIVVEDGGSLYAYGFVSGTGAVTAKSGAKVREYMQIKDFRGGSASSDMVGKDEKVFLFNQYFIQNIEAPLTIEQGATESVLTGLYAMRMTTSTTVDLIGTSGAMFNIKSGSITKSYDGSRDRQCYTVNGEAELSSLQLRVSGMSVSSKDYVLPLTNNMSITVSSGNTTISQDVALLAGTELTIDNGAKVTVAKGNNVYVYDQDEWTAANYSNAGKYASVSYAPSKQYNRSESDLADAIVDVNGTLEAAGSVYTTKGGADIKSSQGTGIFTMTGGAGTQDKTYQVTQSGTSITYANIPITSAKLHNGAKYADTADEYTLTEGAAAGTQYHFSTKSQKWTTEQEPVTVTFDANEGTGTMDDQAVEPDTATALTANAFTREGYDFTGWNTKADGTGDSYADAAEVTLTQDVTLYAQWKAKTFTITWKDADGTTLETDTDVPYDTTPSYDGTTPVKAADAQYTYTFKGWSPEVAKVTGDATYTAVYDQTVNQYTVTWANADGTVISTQKVAYGETPKYEGATPTKPADSQYTYTFKGWNPEVTKVTGDVTYTAQFDKTTNAYTVTWKNADGTTLETDANVPYGTTPSYDGATPTKVSDAQYNYEFSGWNPEVSKVTGDVAYTAQYKATLRTYTITWTNDDGTVLATSQVNYGEKPEFTGSTPTKAADAQYTYTFKGWDPEVVSVTGDATYKATYDKKVNEYTITWVNEDGTELATQQVAYGETPAYTGDTPTKDSDAQYAYTFKGWTPEVAPVTGDATYTAQFEGTVRTYTVTWQADDGETVLQKDENVPYGTTPTFNGANPTKDPTKEYEYTFAGWSPEVSAISGDTNYVATFTAAPRTYHVTFDANGGEGTPEAQAVQYGVSTQLTKGELTREGYLFTGWNTAADGTGTAYGDQAELTPQGDLTLYAQWLKLGWFTDNNGATSFRKNDGTLAKGFYETTSQDGSHVGTFAFDDETGEFQGSLTGAFETQGAYYWVENGELSSVLGLQRLVKSDGEVNYYCVTEGGKVVTSADYPEGGDYWVSAEAANGLLPEWGYRFGEDGVIEHDADTSKNGTVAESDGSLYRYVDGIRVHVGMFEEGGHIYYAKSNGQLVVGQSYWCERTNGIKPAGSYTFDEQGRLVEPETHADGIVAEDGSLFYYKDGKRYYAGLIEIDGKYYYVRTSGELAHGQKYWITKTNGLMVQGSYEFDENGVLQVPETPKQGIYEEDGSLWYYEAGKRTHKGLFELDGSWYYARTSGELVHGRSYWITDTNGLMAQGSYTFADDGKMVDPRPVDATKEGIVSEDGSLYYYENGVRVHKGLFQQDGAYYYARTSGELVHGRFYWITDTNGLMAQGSYQFADDGKMVVK
ncbi:MAG: InlB B-repeat-containing protein [Olsenella sp.]|nr:InlB B-repeat-containing protein [Olsenella sp.]